MSHYLSDTPVYFIGEVMHGDTLIVSEYQTKGNMDALLDYPMYYQLLNVFVKRMPMGLLQEQYIKAKGMFRDIDLLGVFIDNNDLSRILNMLQRNAGLSLDE